MAVKAMRGAAWTPVVILALLVGAPATQAQGGPFYSLQVTEDRSTATFQTVEGMATFQLTLNVTPSGTDPAPAQIRYTVTDRSSTVQGWSSVRIQPTTVTAAATDPVTIRVSVGTLQRDVAAETFTIRLEIRSEPQAQDPLRNQADSVERTLTAVRQLKTSETVSSVFDEYKWYFLGGGVAVVLAGVLLTRRGRHLDISCDEPVQEIVPGRGVSYVVRVRNQDVEEDTFFLNTTDPPKGWTVLLAADRLELKPGDRENLRVTLAAPADATPGDRVNLDVIMSSRNHPRTDETVELEAVVVEPSAGPHAEAELEVEEPGRPEGGLQVEEPGARGGRELEVEEPGALKKK